MGRCVLDWGWRFMCLMLWKLMGSGFLLCFLFLDEQRGFDFVVLVLALWWSGGFDDSLFYLVDQFHVLILFIGFCSGPDFLLMGIDSFGLDFGCGCCWSCSFFLCLWSEDFAWVTWFLHVGSFDKVILMLYEGVLVFLASFQWGRSWRSGWLCLIGINSCLLLLLLVMGRCGS